MSATRETAFPRVRDAIRDVPDFPKPGILFKDITPILSDARIFAEVIAGLTERYRSMRIDKIAAMESRGFIFGAPLAEHIGAGFVPLRKFGKLPFSTVSETFNLEYGTETLEVHTDAIRPGERVVIIDDLLATGGTAEASARLVRRIGGDVVEIAFVVELAFLDGRRRLGDIPVYSMVVFE
ncbi:MAG TPA: adenine phosphoribosyltransferase [Candidatus Krumholzibacteria bacterium]|nr:adenine phosphoribosyltransferase [Candidatus Krumholzibacteria bacterium]